jgi:hypothetical protein
MFVVIYTDRFGETRHALTEDPTRTLVYLVQGNSLNWRTAAAARVFPLGEEFAVETLLRFGVLVERIEAIDSKPPDEEDAP